MLFTGVFVYRIISALAGASTSVAGRFVFLQREESSG